MKLRFWKYHLEYRRFCRNQWNRWNQYNNKIRTYLMRKIPSVLEYIWCKTPSVLKHMRRRIYLPYMDTFEAENANRTGTHLMLNIPTVLEHMWNMLIVLEHIWRLLCLHFWNTCDVVYDMIDDMPTVIGVCDIGYAYYTKAHAMRNVPVLCLPYWSMDCAYCSWAHVMWRCLP